jgi:hypothetical protein
MLTEEQQLKLINLTNQMTELANKNVKLLAESEAKLVEMTKHLQQANEDINRLVAFIMSKGFQPPTVGVYAA